LINDDVFVREHLLSRTVESTHEGSLAKFDLIKQITETLVEERLSAPETERLEEMKQYISEGVYYSHVTPSVAMEI
jgi:hypothetical protein